jgi:putative ABC transport system permease protein
MLKQMFKIVWNRKRANFLIMLEIFFTYLVLAAVLISGLYTANNYFQPLGFEYENVWDIQASEKFDLIGEDLSDSYPEKLLRIINVLKDFDGVEAVGAARNLPYTVSTYTIDIKYKGRKAGTENTEVTDGYKDVFGIEMLHGRWFNRSDDALDRRAVVLNKRLSDEIFGDEDPVNKIVTSGDGDDTKEYLVVGVVSDFRIDGELSGLDKLIFRRVSLENPKYNSPGNILIRVRPGSTTELEEKIMSTLQPMERDWSFEIRRMTEKRKSIFKYRTAPLIVFAVISFSVMCMVGLGLMGVLWQNVTRRTREVGLRRAKGATKKKIYNQILGELMVVTTIGIFTGVILIIQFPILGIIGFVSNKVYFFGITLSIILMYLLSLVCGFYPSSLATKIHPAEALHYE